MAADKGLEEIPESTYDVARARLRIFPHPTRYLFVPGADPESP